MGCAAGGNYVHSFWGWEHSCAVCRLARSGDEICLVGIHFSGPRQIKEWAFIWINIRSLGVVPAAADVRRSTTAHFGRLSWISRFVVVCVQVFENDEGAAALRTHLWILLRRSGAHRLIRVSTLFCYQNCLSFLPLRFIIRRHCTNWLSANDCLATATNGPMSPDRARCMIASCISLSWSARLDQVHDLTLSMIARFTIALIKATKVDGGHRNFASFRQCGRLLIQLIDWWEVPCIVLLELERWAQAIGPFAYRICENVLILQHLFWRWLGHLRSIPMYWPLSMHGCPTLHPPCFCLIKLAYVIVLAHRPLPAPLQIP